MSTHSSRPHATAGMMPDMGENPDYPQRPIRDREDPTAALRLMIGIVVAVVLCVVAAIGYCCYVGAHE